MKVSYRFVATRNEERGLLVLKMPDGESVEIETPGEMMDVIQAWAEWWKRVGPAVHASN